VAAGILAAALVAWLGWSDRSAVAPERDPRAALPDGATEVATEAPEQPETHATAETASSADAIDPARLAAARTAVAGALAEAFAGVPLLGAPAEVEIAVRGFEARTAELARDWPVLRIAQGLVAHAEDAVAGAAVRVLGRRGDVLSARALRDALERPALAKAAVLALGDLGQAGLAGLDEALRRPPLAGLARERVVAIGGERAADVLGAALRRSAPASADAQALLDALVAVEPCPAGFVLDLIRDGALDAERGYRALAATPAAARALLALTRDGARSPHELLGALAVARPADALPWIAARATERDHRDAACAALAAYATADALDVLRDLHARGRAPQALVRASVASLLEAEPSAAADLARRGADAIGSGASAEPALRARELLDLLLDVGAPSAGPGLAALAFQSALPADDRPWAALAVGEIGRRVDADRARDADLLAEGVARLGAERETLAAAALLAATALGRPEAVLLALEARGRLDRARADAIVALCASARDEGTRAVTLFKVARELRPHFDDPKL
jgi:hypothetical protein